MFANARPRSVAKERRARDRILLDIPVLLQFGPDARWVETDASLVDLSQDGMLVRCDRMPAKTQRAFLVIHHLLIGDCVALGAPVRYDGGGFGVRFKHTNDLMQEMIRTLSRKRQDPSAYLVDAAAELRIQISGEDQRK